MSCRLDESLRLPHRGSLVLLEALMKAACQREFAANQTHSSSQQLHVSTTLQDMGLCVQDDYRCPVSGFLGFENC